MSASSFPDIAVGVLVSGLRLLSVTPQPTPHASPTMPSSSLSEKLLRDTLLRDERERQQRLSSSPARPIPKRRHSSIQTSSFVVDRTAISSTRSPSPSLSSFSLGKELEKDGGHSHVRRRLFDGDDEQVLRDKLERALTITESDAGGSQIGKYENDVRDEQGGLPWKIARQSIENESASVISESFLSTTSSASYSNSISYSHESNPNTPQIQTRMSNRAAQNTTSNNQRRRYYSPSAPQTPYLYSTPSRGSPTFNRARSQTDPDSPPPNPYANSPRRNNSSPTATSILSVPLSPLRPTKKSPLPLLGNRVAEEVEEELRLPTLPPSPRFSLGSLPIPPIANPSSQSQTELELSLQGTAAGVARKGKGREPPRPLDFSRQKRHRRDATITQLSHRTSVPRSITVPKRSNNNVDGHSFTDSESSSSGTSVSSESHLHLGYSSSHSSLDEPLSAPLRSSSHFFHDHHLVQQSQSIPSTPSRAFNVRKASNQCRAMQGYVSFANVEGLGEPPLVRDEYDEDVFDEDVQRKGDDGGRNESVPFLPLGVFSVLGWKSPLGDAGAAHEVEGPEQGVVV